MDKRFVDMTIEELKNELKRLKEGLIDIADMHAFTFGTAGVHIGAEKAQNMQIEFEEECGFYNRCIAEVEQELKLRTEQAPFG